MNEILLKDYIESEGLATYSGKIEGLSVACEWVMFVERSDCGYYTENHMIPLLDIVAWVYWKIKN